MAYIIYDSSNQLDFIIYYAFNSLAYIIYNDADRMTNAYNTFSINRPEFEGKKLKVMKYQPPLHIPNGELHQSHSLSCMMLFMISNYWSSRDVDLWATNIHNVIYGLGLLKLKRRYRVLLQIDKLTKAMEDKRNHSKNSRSMMKSVRTIFISLIDWLVHYRWLTLWTPNYFLPNSCRRRLNF